MPIHFLLVPLLSVLFCACNSEPALAPDEEIGELGANASIIRNPVDQGTIDTVNVAKMRFDAEEYLFGSVDKGAVVNHTFAFTNDGKAPLLITNARSTCGCTVPSYPKQPIAPGESGVIEVAFDTKNKSGHQEKPVIITANTYPATTTLYVKGRVETK